MRKNKMRKFAPNSLLAAALLSACAANPDGAGETRRSEEPPIKSEKPCISGVYPHLAYWNNEGECGTGAVVPWAGKLWVVTYGPHCVFDSSDKLYEITPDLGIKTRPESLGGTHANRMIHGETGQLFIGCYAIDSNGDVTPYRAARCPEG